MIHRFAITISATITGTITGIVLLSGCVGVGGANRSAVDQAISFYEGKDCSLSRQLRGLTLCHEDEVQPVYAGHCFQTLGEVSCYSDPRPFPGGQSRVGATAPAGKMQGLVTRASVPESEITRAPLPPPSDAR